MSDEEIMKMLKKRTFFDTEHLVREAIKLARQDERERIAFGLKCLAAEIDKEVPEKYEDLRLYRNIVRFLCVLLRLLKENNAALSLKV